MLNTIFLTLIFTFFSVSSFAQVLIEDFFSSSAEQIVTLTESQDFLIGNIVHPLSGQPSLRQLDLVAKGAQNIELKRTFIPSYKPLNENKGQLFPAECSYAGWVYFPHAHLNVFQKGEYKSKKYTIRETIISVSDPSGVVLSYGLTNSGQTFLKTRSWGVCNGIDDNPSGKYDPRNTSISVEGSRVILDAPDGTKRFYYTSDCFQMGLDKETYTCSYCLLKKEILPNGKVLRYEYNKERQIEKVESLDPQERYVYATLVVNSSIYSNKATYTTNTGAQSVNTHNTAPFYKGTKGKCLDLLYPLNFTNVNTPLFREETSKYVNGPKNSLLTDYSGKNAIFKCEYVAMPKRGKEETRLQVKELSFPGDNKDYNTVYKMDYALGTPSVTKSSTSVTDCYGIKTVYEFYANMLPETIKYFDQNGSLIKTKVFNWTSNQWLKTISILNGQQELLSEKEFEYDSFGNPVLEIFRGDLTGSGLIESNETKRVFSLDGKNLLLREECSNGKITSFTYLPGTNLLKSKLTKKTEETCLIREFREYDDSNNLIKIIEDNGSTDIADNLTDVIFRKTTTYILRQDAPFLHMPEWVEVKYLEKGAEKLLTRSHLVYDVHGNVVQNHVYNGDNKFAYTITKEYDEKGCLLSETNAKGQQAKYTYNAYGKEKSSENFSKKLQKTTTYDPKGRVKSIEEAGSDNIVRSFSYFYDNIDRLIRKADNFDQSTFYNYDLVTNKPVLTKSPHLFTTDGNMVRVIEKSSYDGMGRKITSTDANGNTIKYRYNAYGSVTEILYPDQSKEYFAYTKSGALDTHTLPSGRVINYLYDTLGNVISKSHSMNNEFIGKELFEYKGDLLLKSRDLEGHVTQYDYDGAGRKIHEERCGRVISYHYDTLGNIDEIVRENGENSLHTYFRYDLLGNVLEKRNTDSSGTVLTLFNYTYDEDGNVHTVEHNINGVDAVDTYTHDSFNREISHKNPLGYLTTTEYNENFVNPFRQKVQQKIVKDPIQRSVVETYDVYGRVVKVEKLNAANQIISGEEQYYDACGNTVLHLDHVYQNTDLVSTKKVTKTYDTCNRIKNITRAFGTPEARKTEFTYCPNGKIATKTMPDGISLSYSYDALDNVKAINSSDGSISHSFVHNLLGQLHSATDVLHKLNVQRSLDAHGNVLLEELPDGITIKKSYDDFNRPLTLSVPDGGQVIYTYDPQFLKSVKRLSSSGEVLYEHCYNAYDTSGYLTKESLIADLGTTLHETDLAGQALGVSSGYFTQKNRFDEVGNLVEQIVNDVKEEFGYDDLSQLISESDHQYKYDSTFNRTEDSNEKCEHNALDEQLSVGNLKYAYDLRGNLVEKSTAEDVQTFGYDVLNRLIEVIKKDNKISFVYDPLGRRIGKIQYSFSDDEWNENVRESILYDGNNDIGSLSSEGHIKELRVLGLKEHPEKLATLAIELEGKVYAPLLDSQGNVRRLVDATTKVIAATYDYTAFGLQKNANKSIVNPWQYASKRFDSDISIIDFGKRYYEPALGRWFTLDPAGSINGHNLYQYNFNNPFSYTDPDGRFVFMIPVLCGTFGIGALGTAAVVVEVTAVQVVIGSILTGAVIWGVNEGLTAIDHAIDARRLAPYMNSDADTDKETKKKRNGPKHPDPNAEGYPHTTVEIPGPGGQYTTHNGDGTFKQYRGSGKPHGNIPRPNIKENKINPTPKGPIPGKPAVRPPRIDEIPNIK